MRNEVFLDTAYAIALSSPTDSLHRKALALAEQLENEGSRLVTTSAVLLEIGNALSKLRYRAAAVRLLSDLASDQNVDVVHFTQELYERAFALYSQRADKEWGLTDCISFVVMQDRSIHGALTADEHFRQAGFEPLL